MSLVDPLLPDLAEWDGLDVAAIVSAVPLGGDRFGFRHNERNTGGEIFGGQYLGQALSAALATGHGRGPRVMNGVFLEAARADRPLEAQVQRVRDGRSFAHRRVTLLQSDHPVFYADVTLHDPEPDQPHHQMSAPQVPPPESLANLSELLAKYGDEAVGALARERITGKQAVEVRLLDSRAGLIERGSEPRSDMWFRVRHCSTTDPLMQFAVLAYISDYWANFASRVMHGDRAVAGEPMSSTLSHCIWFHRPPILADWLLNITDSPSTYGGIGLSRGSIFDRSGRLIASTAQDALVRRPRL